MEHHTHPTVDKKLIADALRAQLQGKLDQDQIGHALQNLTAATAKYPAQGQIASLVFYSQVTCQITGHKSFVGHSGGLVSPGGGGTWGDLYTDDLERLYRDTVSFSYIVAAVYFTIEFWDGNSKLLGHFQGGGVGTSVGTGGGTGKWA
jgi:hypothetical protein